MTSTEACSAASRPPASGAGAEALCRTDSAAKRPSGRLPDRLPPAGLAG